MEATSISELLLYIGASLAVLSAIVWNIYYFSDPSKRGYVVVIDIWLLVVLGFYVCVLNNSIPHIWLNVWSTGIRLYTTTALLFIGMALLRINKK
jgi:hypothetical protein